MAALGEHVRTNMRTCLKVTVDERSLILCSLRPGQLEQQLLDLVFTEGENVSFSITGNSPIYLTGNYIVSEEIEPDTEDLIKNVCATEYIHANPRGTVHKRSSNSGKLEGIRGATSHNDIAVIADKLYDNVGEGNSQLVFEIDSDESDRNRSDETVNNKTEADETLTILSPTLYSIDADKTVINMENGMVKRKMNTNDNLECLKPGKLNRRSKLTLGEKHNENQTENKRVYEMDFECELSKKSNKVRKSREHQLSDTSTIHTLPGGLIVQDLILGHGQTIEKDSEVWLNYTAFLSNGKPVDKSPSGKPFKCRLNSGAVIQGLEKGMIGMKVGGKRKLTIPSPLAYGKRGNPPHIPPNEDLVYTINPFKIRSNGIK